MLLVLVGSTASGKSDAAVRIAPALDAEIVSLDSMLVYRGMDVGTAKPRDFRGVPHHLVDILDPEERFDVRRYLARADEAIADIAARNKRPLVVGGTGLYLMGLLKGVFEGVPRDPGFRASLAGVPTGELHARLGAADPEAATRLHENDRRRIVRALEVHAATGVPLHELQRQFGGKDRYDARIAGVRRSRDDLRDRIRTRVDAMFLEGLVEEVARLTLGPTASQAVGYKEVAAALRGEIPMDEARRLVERNTWRLARRQATWWKRFPVHWVDAAPGEGPEELAPRLLAFYRGTISE